MGRPVNRGPESREWPMAAGNDLGQEHLWRCGSILTVTSSSEALPLVLEDTAREKGIGTGSLYPYHGRILSHTLRQGNPWLKPKGPLFATYGIFGTYQVYAAGR